MIINFLWLFYIICDIKYLLYTWSCAWEYLQTSTIVHLQIKKHYGNKLFKLVLLAKAYTNINILTLTWYLNWFLCSFLETISCLYLCTQKCLFPKAHGLIMHWHCWQKRERWQVNCYIVALKVAVNWGKLIAISQMQECIGNTLLILIYKCFPF